MPDGIDPPIHKTGKAMRSSYEHSIVVLLVSLMLVGQTLGQSRVTFDASDPGSNHILPFDRYFTLTIKNVSTLGGGEPIGFRIYELPRKRTSYLAQANDNEMRTILDDCRHYEVNDLPVIGDSVSVPQLLLLKPNKDYYVELTGRRSLTEGEKDRVRGALRTSGLDLGKVTYETMTTRVSFLSEVVVGSFNGYLDAVITAYLNEAARTIAQKGMGVDDVQIAALRTDAGAALESALAEWDTAIRNIVLDDPGPRTTNAEAKRIARTMADLLQSDLATVADVDTMLASDTSRFRNVGDTNEGDRDELLNTTRTVKKEVERLQEELVEQVVIPATYGILASSYDMSTKENAKFHYSLNYGGIYDFYGDKFRMFTTINFFLRPIDHALPLDVYNYSFGQWLLARGSVCIGLTDNSMNDPGSDKRGIVGDRALLLGVGLRVLSFATINGGVLMYEQDDRNPLVTDYGMKFTPYVGLSASLELKNIFGLK